MRRLPPLWLLAACAGAPVPLAEPPLAVAVHYERAGWLAGLMGTAPGAAAPAGAPAPEIEVSVHSVTGEPPGPPVLDAAAWITGSDGAVFAGAAQALGDLRLLLGEPAAEKLRAAPGAPPHAHQRLHGSRATAVPGLATVLRAQGLPDFVLTDAGGAVRFALRGPARELLVVADGLGAAGAAAVLFRRAPAAGRPGLAIALRRLGDADPATVAAATAQAEARQATVDRPGAATLPRQFAQARAAVGERNRRPALLALAHRLQLEAVEDLLLAVDEATLVAITAALPDPTPPGAPDLPWRVAREVWTASGAAAQRGASPGLHACLLRQLGALAHDPAAVELLLQTCADGVSFAAALRDGNLAALGDRRAAPRVRAHDWLAARGAAVPGFDPLLPQQARREALRRAAAARAEAAEGGR
ncbi:MAG: hypothetical protein FJ265_12885 [Planctomycetes bacterium]|nr:hypothetical protein [Planctomycetota bacterium]